MEEAANDEARTLDAPLYSDRIANLERELEQARAECDQLKIRLHDQRAAIRLVQASCESGVEIGRAENEKLREALAGVMPFVGYDAEFSVGEWERYNSALNSAKGALELKDDD